MTRVIHLERSIAAPADAAWEACATPRGIARWQADEVTGTVERGSSLALRWPALGARVDLDVVDVAPERRLVLRSGDALLALDLAPGSIQLEHGGLAPGDELEGVASSWRLSLSLLAQSVERHRGRDRRVEWVVRRARTNTAAAHAFFTDGSALGSWLARHGSVGPEGSRYELELMSGTRMSGRVLSHTPARDVALEWSEQGDSVLVMRTLPSPVDPDDRLIALCWSRWGADPPPDALKGELAAALDRLARILGGDRSA